ncbi:MAG: secretin N-terminal domain-containing protein, partial [Paraglaciecola sp.]|nr:secretin N-terminal domain-containing protein [Paraglaciecola sp.]
MAFRKTVLFTLGAFVCACQAPQKKSQSSTAMDAAIAEYAQEVPNAPNKLDTLPAAVTQALLPDLNNAEQPFFSESKYDISAHQLDAATFFSGIVQGTPYSVAIHPEVSGTISLELKQVALADIFDLVSDLYGYDIQRKQNIYRIYPAGLRTETIPVNYLLMKRDGSTQTSITSGGVSQGQSNNNNTSNSQNNFSGNSSNRNSSNNNNNMGTNNNGTNIATSTETDFWKELLSTLKTMVPEEQGKNVMVTPQAGLVTVRAMPDEIRAVKNFLNVSEEIVQRQVILEARIIEVSLSDGYQQGINWNQILSHVGSTDVQFSTTSGSIGYNISAALGNIT